MQRSFSGARTSTSCAGSGSASSCACVVRPRMYARHTSKSFFYSESGQSSVEAALLLPTVMVALAFLLQPMCVLYTRSIMYSAAAETARTLTTATDSTEEAWLEDFALRRLQAVPNLSIFHEGADSDWDIQLSGMGESEVTVEIVGHIHLIPLLGIVATAFGTSEGSSLEVKATVTEEVRPSWLSGSYTDWIEVWDG